MKYPFPDLTGLITDPSKALDKILNSYFYSDRVHHGIKTQVHGLRHDVNDGDDVAGNVQRSLNNILSAYFSVYSVEAEETERNGGVRYIELGIYINDDGRIINFENLLNIEDGSLKSITEVGHL